MDVASSKPPSLIAKIEIFRLPPRWLFCRVETSDGIIGWGESGLEGHTEATEGAYADLQRFVGCDAEAIAQIWQHAYRARSFRGGPILMSAMSGLDIALWDVKGQKLGVPVWQLLGGRLRERVKVYGSIKGVGAEMLFTQALLKQSQGFSTVKISVDDFVDASVSRLLDDMVNKVKDLRSLGIDVCVDFQGLGKSTAKQLAKALEPYNILFIQEPILSSFPNEIGDLAKTTSTPIAMGAHLFHRSDFRPFLESRAIAVAQPDVSHCGGISELVRIASLAETFDVTVSPRSTLGPIALAASLQVSLTIPNFGIQEMSWQTYAHFPITLPSGEQMFPTLHTYLLNAESFRIHEGHMTLSGNGIGVKINEPLVRETAAIFARESRSWRHHVDTPIS